MRSLLALVPLLIACQAVGPITTTRNANERMDAGPPNTDVGTPDFGTLPPDAGTSIGDCPLPAFFAELRRPDGTTLTGCFPMRLQSPMQGGARRGPVYQSSHCRLTTIYAQGDLVDVRLTIDIAPPSETGANFPSAAYYEAPPYSADPATPAVFNRVCQWRLLRPASLNEEFEAELVSPCTLQETHRGPAARPVELLRLHARGQLFRGYEPSQLSDAGVPDCGVQ